MITETYADPVAGTTNAETLNYPALIGSILHQIRYMHSREMCAGMMFYSMSIQDGVPVKVPSHYMPDNRLGFFESVAFLEQLLSPYVTKEDKALLTKFAEECADIKKKAHEKYLHLSEKEGGIWNEITARDMPRWKEEMMEEQTQKMRPLFDSRFNFCVQIIYKLNLLPKVLTSRDAYNDENVV